MDKNIRSHLKSLYI